MTEIDDNRRRHAAWLRVVLLLFIGLVVASQTASAQGWAHADMSICPGVTAPSITFPGSASGPFTWISSINIGFGTSGSGTIPAYTAPTTGLTPIVATVVVTPSDWASSGVRDTFLVTVQPTPTVVAHSDSIFCRGVTAPGLTFTGTLAGTTFPWRSSANVGFGTAGTGNIAAYTTVNSGTTFLTSSVVVTPTANGCAGTPDTFLLTVKPGPTVVAHGDSAYCPGVNAPPISFTGGVSGTTFTWTSSNDVGFGTGGTGSIPVYTTVTTGSTSIVTTVTVTTAANGCSGNSDTFLVTVKANPTVVAHGDTIFCKGIAAPALTFAGSVAGTTFPWTSSVNVGFGTSGAGNIGAYTTVNSGTTLLTSTVIVIPTAVGCAGARDTFLITVNPSPNVIAHGDSTYCTGVTASTISFTGGVGSTAFTWTSSADVGFGTSGVGTIPAYTTVNAGTTSLVATVIVAPAANGCNGVRDTFLITIKANPTVAAHGDTVFCKGVTAPLLTFAGSVAGTTFPWTSSVNVGFGTSGTGNIGAYTTVNSGTAPLASTVVVTPTAGGCMGARDTFLVTVNPSPNVIAHGDSTYCAGVTAPPISFTGGVGSATFTWTSSADAGFGTSGVGAIPAYTTINTGSTSLVTTVIVTPAANGCNGAKDTFRITVKANPNVVAHGDSTYCKGVTGRALTFTGSVAGTAFSWSSSINVGFGTSGTGNISSYTTLNSGTTALVATVMVTPSANGCTGVQDTFLVTVNPVPNVAAHGDSTYCKGETTSGLTFTGAVGGTTFTWTSSASVGFGTSGTGDVNPYTTLNSGATALVSTVVVTPSANGCAGTRDTFLITVKPTPNVVAHGDSTYCKGAMGRALTFAGSVAGATYSWTSSVNVGFGTSGAGNISSYTTLNSGATALVATVIVTPSANGCTGAPDTFLITVNPVPYVAAHGDSTYCKGETTSGLTFAGAVAGTTFTWTSSVNVGFGTGGTGDINPYITQNAGTTTLVTTVVVTPSANGCTGTRDTFLITVKPVPSVTTHGDSTYCKGVTAPGLAFTGSLAGTTFAWTSSENVGFGTNGTGNISPYTTLNGGTTALAATVIVTPSANGCAGTPDTFLISIKPAPNVAAHGDSTYCKGEVAPGLTFAGDVVSTTFAWTSSVNVGFGTNGTGNINSYTTLNTGTSALMSTVIITPSANGCTGTRDTFHITVAPAPNVATHGDSTYCKGVTAPGLTFTGAVAGTSFNWTSSENVGFGISGAGNIAPYTTIDDGTTALIGAVIVTPSANGCTGTPDTFNITVKPAPGVVPHGDSTYCKGVTAPSLIFAGAVAGTIFSWTSSVNVGFGTSGTGNINPYTTQNSGTTALVSTVIVRPSANGCIGIPDSFSITVSPAPNVVARADSSYCNGQPASAINFTGSVAGTTFTWISSANVGFGTNGTGNIAAYIAANTSLASVVATVVVIPSVNGCAGTPDTFRITVIPNPTMTPVADRVHCKGDAAGGINFTGGAAGATFTWVSNVNVGFGTSGAGSIGSYTAANGGATPAVATVTVTPSTTGCLGAFASFDVTVNPTPGVAAHGDSSYCKGEIAPGMTFTGTVAGITYSWTSSVNVGFGTSGAGNIPPYTTLNGGATAIVSTIVATPSANGCSGIPDIFLVTVKPAPGIIAHGDSTYCKGVTAPGLTFSGTVAGTSFTWTSSVNVGFGTSGSGNISSYTTLNSGTTALMTTVVVTPLANGCTGSSDTFHISVSPAPGVVEHGDSTYCKGESAPGLNFTGTVAGTTFAWTSSANVGFGTSGSGNINPYTTINGGTTAIVSTVIITPSANGCAGTSDTFHIAVSPAPGVIAHGDSTYCKGEAAPGLTFAGTVAGTTFTWTSSVNVGFGVNGTGNINPYTTLNSGTTALMTPVIVTPSANGCAGTPDTFHITVSPAPGVVAHGDSTYCKGVTAPGLTFIGTVVGSSFTWTSSANVGFGTSGTGNINPYTTLNGGTTALTTTAVVTPSASGCTGTPDTFHITVTPTPNVAAHNDTAYCNGQPGSAISFTGSVTGTTFTWSSSADVGFGTSGIGNIGTYVAANPGMASIVGTVIVTPSANGCIGTPDTFRITVNPNPTMTPVADRTHCKGDAAGGIAFTGGAAGATFTWVSNVNVGFGTSGAGSIGSYTAANGGSTPAVATVTVTPSATGCPGAISTFDVTVNPAPNVVAYGDSTYCKGVTAPGLTFTGAVPGTTFAWTSSVNVGFGTSGAGDVNPYITLNGSTTSLMTTMVLTPSVSGCIGSPDTFHITVTPAPDITTHGDSPYCKGVTAPGLTFAGSVAGTSFAWTSSVNVGFGTIGTGNINPYTTINGGTIALVSTVIVTPSANGCAGGPDTFHITVSPAPGVAAHGDSTYCKGQSAPGLTFTGTVAGTSFSWISSVNVGFGTSGTGDINPYTTLNSGTAALMSTVVVTPSANGCAGIPDTFHITVSPAPGVVAHGDSTYCKGVTAPGLTFAGTVAGTSFTWTSSVNVGFGTDGSGDISPYTTLNSGSTALMSIVIVTPSANGCAGTPDTFQIAVSPAPGVIAHGDSAYCKGETAPGLAFAGTVAGTSFTWTSSMNVGFGTSGAGNINPYTTLNGGTTAIVSTVVVTPSANGCAGIADTFLITVTPAPNVLAHGDSTYCNGQPASAINFAGGGAGTTFNWISSSEVGIGTSGAGNIGAYVAANAGLSPVTATVVVIPSANGCTGTPDTFLITVNSNPTMTPVANRAHCNGDAASAINFTGGASGATFTWVSNVNVGFGTSGAGSIGSYTATNGGATTAVAAVTVTPSTTGCPGAIATFNVTVNPTPGIAAHGDSTYCKGVTAPGLIFTGGATATVYNWTSSDNVGFGTIGTGDINPYTTVNGGTTALVTTVIVTPSAGSCAGTPDTFHITVTPAPDIVAHGDSTYCKGVTAPGITFTGTVAGTTFTWTSSANVGFGAIGTGNINSYTALNSGTAALVTTVIATPSANGCVGIPDTFLIAVNPAPGVIPHGDSTYCKGVITPGLAFTGTAAGTTSTWTSSVNVGFGTTGTGDVNSYTTINGGTTALATTVIVTPSANGCAGIADTFLVTVTPDPGVGAHNDTTYCNGQPASAISFTGGVAGTTFNWTSSNDVGFGTSGIGNISAYVAANAGLSPAVATVVVAPSANGCIGSPDTFMITVNPNPTMTPVANRTHCNGDAAGTINFTGGAAGATFSWASDINVGFGTGGAGSIGSYTAANGSATPAVATVTVTPSATGCPGAISTFNVTVNPTPAVAALNDTTYCNGQPAPAINFIGGVAGTSFNWMSSDDVGFGTSGAGNISAYVAANAGLAPVVATVITTPSANGCTGTTDTFLVTVNSNPTMTPVANRLHCNKDTAGVINFTGGATGATFTWASNVNVGFGTSGAGSIGSYTAANGGATPAVATVTVTPSTTGCPGAISTFNVTVNPTPDVAVHGDTTYCNGQSAPAINFTGGVVGATYMWTSSANVGFGTGGAGNIGSYTATNTGLATVVVIPSISGCVGVPDTFIVTVNPLPGAAIITGSTSVVAGSNITLSDTVTGGTWNSGAPGIATVSGSGVVSGLSPGTAMISYSVMNSCGTATATIVVTVDPLNDPISGVLTVCVGSTTSLTSSVPGGTWSSGDTAKAMVSSAGVVTGIAPGIAIISYSVFGSITTAIVTVNPLPVAGAITGTATVCMGNAITLSNTTGGGSWSSGAPGIATVDTGGVVTGIAGGTALVSYAVVNGCGTAVATQNVIVNPAPGVAEHGDSIYCNGQPAPAINFTGSVTGATFSWTSSGDVGFGTSGTGNISAYVAANASLTPVVATVVVAPSANGCIGVPDTFVITVNPNVTMTPVTNRVHCNGDAAGMINFTGGAPGATFTWVSNINVGFGTSGAGSIGSYTAANGGIVPAVATVTVTPSASSCPGAISTFNVTVNPTPVVAANNDTTYCNGQPAPAINFVGGVAGTAFNWTSSNDIGFGTGGTGSVGLYVAANTGSAVLVTTVVVTPSANGCSGTPDTFLITVKPNITMTPVANRVHCNGNTAGMINFTGGAAGATFTWVSNINAGFGTSGAGNIGSYTAVNTGAMPAVATVTVSPGTTGCPGAVSTFNVTVNPTPGIASHNDTTYCNGQPAPAINFVGGVAGTAFNWTSSNDMGFGTGGTGTIGSYVASNTGSAVLVTTVVVTPSANGCTGASDTFLITVKPNMTMTPVANRVHCNGDTAGIINFTGGAPGATFTWVSSVNAGFGTSGVGGIGSYTAANGGATPAVATVTVTPGATGCPGAISTFNVTVNPTPGVAANNDTTYCNGQPAPAINFAGSVSGTAFNWTSTADVGFGTLGAGSIGSYVATNAGSTVLATTVVVTPSANGCTGIPDTFVVTVNPNMTMTPVADRIHCSGDTAGIINFTGGPAGAMFTWVSNTNVGFGTSGVGSIGSYTAANGGTTPAVATVTVTPGTTSCAGTISTFNVTVNPTPVVVANSNATYCNGQPGSAIVFAGGVAGTTFNWTSSANVGFGAAGTGSIGSFTATNAGLTALVTTVVVTPSANGCTGIPDTFLITVNPTPGIVMHGDSTYCAGTLASGLSFTGSIPGSAFNWTSSLNVGFGTSGSGNIPSYTTLNSGLSPVIATVIVTPAAAGCPGVADTFLITVNPGFTMTPVASRSHCAGTIGSVITFSSSTPGSTFTWTSSSNVGFGTAGTGNIGAYTALNTGSTPAVTTVTVTPSATGCGGGAVTFMVTVYPIPSVVAHGDSTYCKGIVAPALNFTSTLPGTTFAWGATANVGFGTSGTGNIPPYFTLNPGSTDLVATVMVTPTTFGCPGATDVFHVTVKPTPAVAAHADTAYCNGQSAAAITFASAIPGTAFNWIATSDVGFGTAGSGNIAAFTAANGDTLGIVSKVIVTASAGGCTGANDTFTVTVNPAPVVPTFSDITVCSGTSISMIDITGTDIVNIFTWTGTLDAGFGTSGVGNIGSFTTMVNPGPGNVVDTLSVYVTAPGGCTSAPAQFTVTVLPGLFVVARDTVCSGGSLDLTPLGTPAGGTWSGPGVSGGTFNSSGLALGTYMVYYNVDNGSCSGLDSAEITVSDYCIVNGAYTQDVYGRASGEVCDGAGQKRSSSNLIGYLLQLGGQITVGRPGRSVIIPVEAAAAVNAVLPGRNIPFKLTYPDNVTISNTPGSLFDTKYLSAGALENSMLGEQIAMKLNIRMSPGLLNFPVISRRDDSDSYFQTFDAVESGCTFSCGNTTPMCFGIRKSVARYLTRGRTRTATLKDLVNLADDLLGDSIITGANNRGYIVPSYADVTSALSSINEAFSYFRTFKGVYGGCNTDVTTNTDSIDLIINIYPNPTSGAFTIEIQGLKKDAHVSALDVLGRTSLLSATIPASPYEQKLQLEFPREVARGVYLIRIETGGVIYARKLVLE